MNETTNSADGSGVTAWFARFAEWLWRKGELQRARARTIPLTEVQRRRLQRAEAAAAQAERILTTDALGPADKYLTDPEIALPLAMHLYREAAYWALMGYLPDADRLDPAAAFQAVPAEVILQAAGDEQRVQAVRQALIERSSADTAALDPSQQRAEVERVRSFVRALVQGLDVHRSLVPRLLLERWSRVALLAAILAGGYWVAGQVRILLLPELAENSRWRASSAGWGWPQEGVGFRAPEGGPNIFFHTEEEDTPWVEFDLGRVTWVTYVKVQNRLDCCQTRAVPLVVEVSKDRRHWTEVARRTESFYYWDTTFPRTEARYVRLRVPSRTTLHLGPVSIR